MQTGSYLPGSTGTRHDIDRDRNRKRRGAQHLIGSPRVLPEKIPGTTIPRDARNAGIVRPVVRLAIPER